MLAQQPVVEVVDAQGRTVAAAGVEVTVALTSGGVLLGTPAATTDAGGVAHFIDLAIGGATGGRRLEFRAAGLRPDTSIVVTLAAGRPVSMVATSADSQAGVVGTPVASAPTVRLRDADSNLVAGDSVTFRVIAGGGELSASTVVTSSLGVATPGEWTLGPLVGVQQVEARSGSDSALTRIFTASARHGSAVQLVIAAGNLQTATVRDTLPVRPAVRVQDRFGNAVPGVPVLFALDAAGTTISGTSPVSDTAGLAVAGPWVMGTRAAEFTLSVTAPGVLDGVVFRARALPGPPALLLLGCCSRDTLWLPTGSVIGAGQYFVVQDSFANPVDGVPVSFTATGGGRPSPAATTSDAGGEAVLDSWTLGATPGLQTLTVTAAGLTLTLAHHAHAGRLLVKVSGDSQQVAVGTVTPAPAVVRLTDSAGVPVAGVPIAFIASGGSLAGAGPVVTDADGVATAPAWTVGTRRVDGSSLTANLLRIPPATFLAVLLPGPLAGLRDVTTGDFTPFVGYRRQPEPLVFARDQYGNGIAGVPLTWSVIAGGGSIVSPPAATDSLGLAMAHDWFMGTEPGLNRLRVTTPLLPTDTGVTYQVQAVAGPPESLIVVSGDGQSARVRSPLPVRPRFRLQDRFGHRMVGSRVTFQVLSGGGSVDSPSAVTDSAGEASIGWTLGPYPGNQTLLADVLYPARAVLTAIATAPPPAALVVVAGSNQSARAGALAPIPLAVRVLDSTGAGVAGTAVSFLPAPGGGSIGDPSATTDTGGYAFARQWTLGPGTNTVVATAAGVAQVGAFTAQGRQPGGFSMNVNFVTQLSPQLQQVFTDAAARWSQVIVGDVPDQPVTVPANTCFNGQGAFSTTIDDLMLYVIAGPIDGVGGILGGTGVCVYRPSGLPAIAVIQLDSDDLNAFAAYVPDIVLHEMGHALGLGSTWQSFGLVQGAGGSDPLYLGASAVQGYWAVRGATGPLPAGVPLETQGGAGTRDVHWLESRFGGELMTGFINSPPNPMSLITTGSLQDLGYLVDNAAADLGYTVAGLRAQAAGPAAPFREAPWTGPTFQAEPDGTLKRR